MGQRCSKATGNVKGNGTGIDGSNNFVDATGEIPRGTELKRTKDTDYEERRPKEDSFDSRRSKLMHRDSLRLGACKMRSVKTVSPSCAKTSRDNVWSGNRLSRWPRAIRRGAECLEEAANADWNPLLPGCERSMVSWPSLG